MTASLAIVAAKLPVPLPVTSLVKVIVWSPVLEPDTETAPTPIVKTEVLAMLPTRVTVPVFTVRAVVKVALVTVVALPVRLAVIVPALKFPDASRWTNVLAVFAEAYAKDAKFLLASVTTACDAVNPERLSPANVGEDAVAIFYGRESVIEPTA